jgi:hypothetical protein
MATVRVGRHPARIACHLFATNVTVPAMHLFPLCLIVSLVLCAAAGIPVDPLEAHRYAAAALSI